ncbi:hypothetical protein KC799_15500, partial [candidate division KSB1 bacterium]|nr:hypothetical protein [candidate division KSB1 bacterium]
MKMNFYPGQWGRQYAHYFLVSLLALLFVGSSLYAQDPTDPRQKLRGDDELRRSLRIDPNSPLPSELLRQQRQQIEDEAASRKLGGVVPPNQKKRELAEELGLNFSVADERCATEEYNEYLKQRYNMSTPQEFEEWMEQKLIELGGYNPGGVIPVVVHVLHNGQPVGVGPNITEAQVLSQIKVLNDDFQRALGTRGAETTS